jgi:streptomycin 6-kinase
VAGTSLTLAEWRVGAPELAEQIAEEWGLRLGEEYEPGVCGHVVRAELPDGTAAVLKVHWPHRESLQEGYALERWDGDGAVRLLAEDDERSALLLERCEPGTALSSVHTEEALDVLTGLLPRLWKSAEGFATAEDEVPYLSQDLQQARDRDLKDAARAYLRDLVPTQGERVLVNEDLHGENVLAAGREPWLVIDPKPVAAERELGVAPIVRSFELGHSKRRVLYRLDRLCSDLELDRERALGWTVAHTVAWSGGSDYIETHIETVRWLLEAA